jgi:hypothetical protein
MSSIRKNTILGFASGLVSSAQPIISSPKPISKTNFRITDASLAIDFLHAGMQIDRLTLPIENTFQPIRQRNSRFNPVCTDTL